MKAPILPLFLVSAAAGLAGVGAGCSSFQHVPAGQSVLVSQAKKPVVIATPTPVAQIAMVTASDHQAFTLGNQVLPDLPRSEPLPPTSMADYFALGNSLLQQGDNTAAADAFKKATELDPSYAEAWHNLALSYESAGDEADAVEAFRHYKSLPTSP